MADRSSCDPDDSAEIEGAVIGYLHHHPRAADTLDGIVDWWLPQQRNETARARIESVLVRLVDAGLLHSEHLPGGVVLYALERGSRAHPRTH